MSASGAPCWLAMLEPGAGLRAPGLAVRRAEAVRDRRAVVRRSRSSRGRTGEVGVRFVFAGGVPAWTPTEANSPVAISARGRTTVTNVEGMPDPSASLASSVLPVPAARRGWHDPCVLLRQDPPRGNSRGGAGTMARRARRRVATGGSNDHERARPADCPSPRPAGDRSAIHGFGLSRAHHPLVNDRTSTF